MPRRLLLIANPISGGGRGAALAEQLAAELHDRGLFAELYRTKAAGDAAARARTAHQEDWHGLIAIGGDGTVNEVLNGMPDPSRPLGMLPVGTANVLSIELGLPRLPAAAADIIAAGHLRELAIGRCDEQRFLLFVGVGIDGAIVKRCSETRKGTMGKHKYIAPVLHTAWHWPRPSLAITLANGERLDGLSSVLVSRVRNYGGILSLTPDVSADSGQLHVLAFRMRSRTAWLYHSLRALFGRLRPGPHLSVRATERVTIEGDAPLQIDGDAAGCSPVTIDLLPERARLFAPPAANRDQNASM